MKKLNEVLELIKSEGYNAFIDTLSTYDEYGNYSYDMIAVIKGGKHITVDLNNDNSILIFDDIDNELITNSTIDMLEFIRKI